VHRVADCIIWRVIPQPTEGQRIGNQIDAAFIFARSDIVQNGFHNISSFMLIESLLGARMERDSQG
jgi:hypothetical protein